MLRLLVFSLFFALISCMSSEPVKVVKLNDKNTQNFEVVMLSDSDFNLKIRHLLSDKGVSVKKYTSVSEITTKSASHDVKFNQAAARYGIEVNVGNRLDYCVTSAGEKYKITVEVVDLQDNKTLFYVEQTGWTVRCGWHKGGLLEELVEKLVENLPQ